jgi:GT2 family glycosyltransferase
MNATSTFVTSYRGRNFYEVRNAVGDSDIIIFTMLGLEELELMKYFKSVGKKIVYDFNEDIFGYPMQHECFSLCDVIVCCSTALAEKVVRKGYKPACIIKDAVEDIPKRPVAVYENRYERPKAVYAGMGGNSFLVTEYLKDTIEKAGYDLVLVTEWDNATIKWNPETWPIAMSSCDVALCPQRVDVQPAKSNVKVTTAMDLGLPVIASPLQSYREIIKHGENGFLCETQEEWYEALVKLKDPEVRKQIGSEGKRTSNNYTLEKIAEDWCIVTDHLLSGNMEITDNRYKNTDKRELDTVKAREQVDIIITNYNNVEYLKLCVSSIMMNTLYPFHLIISDAGSDKETWDYLNTLKGITILGKQGERKNFSQACNAGIRHSKTKYFVIMNSDLIVSKCWLTSMVEKMGSVNRLAACGVLSNCDRGWLHGVDGRPMYPMKLEKSGIELVPGMKYAQIKPNIDELNAFMNASNKKYKDIFVEQPWVAAYCTIFARSAVEEVGYFDISFRNGCEDLDLCRRLRKFDYNIGQAIDSFVFHFGGVSRGAYENENKDSYQKEDRENHYMFKAKWDKQKVLIWTGPAHEPWNKQKVLEGMAGSETWATYLAEALTKKGYEVIIYNDLLVEDKNIIQHEFVDGVPGSTVKYRHYSKLEEDVKYMYVDYFISSRSVVPLKNRLHSHHHYVMIHDVFLHPDTNHDILLGKVEKYAYLSEWHKQFLMRHHKIPADKLFLTANGVVQSLYSDVDTYTKKNKMIYSSSADRGLYQLLKMFPLIKEQVPDFELCVAYGFFNWKSSCAMRKDVESLKLIEKIEELLKQPGVTYLDRVDKKTLAHHQKESKVWLMPEWFHETFSITAVENGLAKNAIITSDLGGLKTTVGSAGMLLSPKDLSRDNDYPEDYINAFVEKSVGLLKDEGLRKVWADKAYTKMVEYSWDKVADGWVEQFKS